MKPIRTLSLLLAFALFPIVASPAHSSQPTNVPYPTAEPLRSPRDAEPVEPPASDSAPLDYARGGQGKPFNVSSGPSADSAGLSFASNWHIECVDCPKWFGWMSIQLDDADHPHIAYGGDHLYYAWHDGTEWHYVTVDQSPGVGVGASLALDDVGRPHITYESYHGSLLKYAWHDGEDWRIETVDHGSGASLALDNAGRPHISYRVWYTDTYVIKYARKDGTDWHSEMVDSEAHFVVGSISLALDGASRPHISYHEGNDDGLKYAWNDETGWHIETITVGSSDLVGHYHSLAMDGLGRPHVSFSDLTNDDLKYAWRDGETWHVEIVDSAGGIGTSLALDGAGQPHIGYASGYPDDYPRHAWHDGTTWHIETVDNANVNFSVSLTLDGAGQPHVSYLDDVEGGLKYARHDGMTWRVETVDKVETIGSSTSLALNDSGQPRISFYGRGLKYAWRDGAAWHIETVDGGGGVNTSLALDDTGRPHIGYDGDGIKYAWHDGTDWHIEVVAGEWSSSQYGSISMQLNSTGQPHIVSHRGFCSSIPNPGCTYAIKHFWRDGTQWHSEIVETGSSLSVGSSVSLVLDAADHPHICYDSGSGITYARHNGTHWEAETVVDYSGSAPSLALDEAGEPHISYFAGYPNDGLKYAWRDGAAWHTETVDVAVDVSVYTTLELDESSRPHISYRGWDSDALKYAWHDETGWHTEVLEYKRGGRPSLALDSAGRPHVAYQARSPEYDLKYAWRAPLVLGKQATPTDGLRNNEVLTYTLTLSAPGLSVRLSDPLPPLVRYVPGSITGTVTPAAFYSPTIHAVVWQGTLLTDTVQTIRFQVTPDITGTGSLDLSRPIINTAWLTDTDSGWNISAMAIVNGWRIYAPLILRND